MPDSGVPGAGWWYPVWWYWVPGTGWVPAPGTGHWLLLYRHWLLYPALAIGYCTRHWLLATVPGTGIGYCTCTRHWLLYPVPGIGYWSWYPALATGPGTLLLVPVPGYWSLYPAIVASLALRLPRPWDHCSKRLSIHGSVRSFNVFNRPSRPKVFATYTEMSNFLSSQSEETCHI